MAAPVSVAMSTMASGASSTASERPSASTSRPSASVLWISTVLPLRIVSTSPSLSALPDGMLSVHINQAVTLVRTFRSLSTLIVASTAAAPDMSIFMFWWNTSWPLSEMPPESYMIPLPTRAR